MGGYGSNAPTQLYKDETGVFHVVPQNSADFSNYWTAKSLDTSWIISELATITELTAQVLFAKVLPALNLTLSAEEQNRLTEIQKNVITNYVSTLTNIAPIGQPKTFIMLPMYCRNSPSVSTSGTVTIIATVSSSQASALAPSVGSIVNATVIALVASSNVQS